MVTQVVEIAGDGRHVSRKRGFLHVAEDGAEVGRVPLDDVTALVLTSRGVTLSKSLMAALAERGAVVVTCGANWHPVSFTLPYGTHFDAAGILHDQIACSRPLKKRLWQAIVREKIANQKTVLDWHAPGCGAAEKLGQYVRRVGSGDPANMEAQAARAYWPALMGAHFRRDRTGDGVNACLNYGYAILRAAVARAVAGAGLTPALGIHHSNRKNPFALVDDLMEPFRPIVDSTVYQMREETGAEALTVTVESKRTLSAILDLDVEGERGIATLMNALHRLAKSTVDSIQAAKPALAFPRLAEPNRLL